MLLSNIVVYKAVFNNFDEVLPIPISGVRKVLFSNRPLEVDGWDNVVLHCEDAIMENRKLKMFPWKYLDEDFSIYLDGRLDITPKFFEFLLTRNLRDKLIVPIHRNRGDVLDEVIRCINHRRISGQQLRAAFELSNLNAHAVECGLIVRDHNSLEIKAHALRWMERFREIGRDQLAFHDSHSSEAFKTFDFDLSNTEFFSLRNHKFSRLKQIDSRLRLALRLIFKGKVI